MTNLRVVLAGALAFSMSCASASCATAPDFALHDQTAPSLVVVTWNVNYGLAGHHDILDVLELIDADVVLLQETTPEWERALKKRFKRKYPHRAFHHEEAAGGLAILSKSRITASEVLPAVTWFPAWRGVVDTTLGPIEFLIVHLRPPFDDDGSVITGWFRTPAMRDDEVTMFLDAVDGAHPLIVVGDMNEGSGPATRRLAAHGLDDALDHLPDQETWRWSLPVIDLVGRYDHLFVDRHRLAIVDATVIEVDASDHYPVVATIQKQPEACPY